ncbi:hypothetical protein CFN78_11740 [Amycolatopsis antarctica]|uniref:VOC domain-containing protein n=1 Tax=Amycolatopsis antarctica TaxID=1854586 RepID=A0A263D6R7_9PSEU|nr:VOC family protein [Amycolatopsis antarctica]OZM73105.1 hypothetical protein CFN78_11740 [Amycolatopsis antarctica]
MLRGLATISLFADNLPAAVTWYSELLGIEPYFVRPVEGPTAYAEFRIGDHQHELGIIDSRYRPHPAASGASGAVVYWHVDDAHAAYADLLARGAREHEAPVDREAGFVTASVLDPFGNILGVMYNPHYLDMLGTRNPALRSRADD